MKALGSRPACNLGTACQRLRTLPVDFSLGGLLTLALESQLLSPPNPGPAFSFPVRVADAGVERRLPSHWTEIKSYLNIEFQGRHVDCELGKSRDGLGEVADYSLSLVNALYEENPKRSPILRWDSRARERVRRKVGSLAPKSGIIGLHFRQGATSATSFGRAFADLARGLIVEPRLQSHTFLVLGNHAPGGFTDYPRVVSAEDSGWNLAEQLIGSTETSFFIGEASGFCTAAIFSQTPYLIYKDPDQHAGTVDRDIGPGGKILFSNDSQLFLRQIPTSENAATKIAALIAKSRVGRRLTWQGPGVESLP